MLNKQREFELVVRTFSDGLYRYAYFLSKNSADAEDLVQDCFQRAWKNWHKLENPKAIKQWLFVILRREFLTKLNNAQPVSVSIEEADMLLSSHLCPEEVYKIRQALLQAPSSLTEPLLLQVLGGFSCDEIAQLQNTSSGAVMTRLTRARQWLKGVLGDEPQKKAASS